MARIGEYRLKVYELLYNKPICNYCEFSNNKKEFNILILGNGWAGNEAFKASFWAGQYANSILNITVASRNALCYKEKIYNNLPAFDLFANQKEYANTKFIDINLVEGQSDDALVSLNFKLCKYNYIIVALGDAEHNWLAASEILSRISEVKDTLYNGNVILNIFDEFTNAVHKEDQNSLIQDGFRYGIEVNFFGKEEQQSDLLHTAQNINFAYALKYNQRIGKSATDAEFNNSIEEEFKKSPFDYEIDDLDIVRNFIGSNYSADSSIASALHIPYKLEVCRDFNNSLDPLETLGQAIQSRNTLYNKLVALEHRRWNAYMVTRGYRAPSEKEEQEYLYKQIDSRYNKHKDDVQLLHICLCDCKENGTILESDFFNQYKKWIDKKCPKNIPSELDRASLRCHQLTSELSRKISAEELFTNIIGENISYINLRKSINKLLNDEENSLALYEKALTEAKKYANTISEDEKRKISFVDQQLAVVKVRNSRLDFLSLDAQLIEMIPFALWYDYKYSTVITVSDEVAAQDVIVPTLLNAQKAIFILKDIDKEYRNTIKNYFRKRGNVTTPIFIKAPLDDMNSIIDKITKLVDSDQPKNTVINFVPHNSQIVSMAVGRLIEKYQDKLSIVSYDSQCGLVPFSGDRNIGLGLNNKSISVEEYVELLGGKVSNKYETIYDTTRINSLIGLFEKYCTPIVYQKNEKQSGTYAAWIRMSKFFSESAKDDYSYEERIVSRLQEEKGTKFNEELFYQGLFFNEIYKKCDIGKCLKTLCSYRIISDYFESVDEQYTSIKFKCYDPEIIELVSEFDIEHITQTSKNLSHKKIKFSPESGIRISNLFVENKPLHASDDPQIAFKIKCEFLQEMQKRNFIKNLQFHDDETVSFMFSDEATKELFKKQGTALELAVYNLLRDTAIFDDIETGTKISWNSKEQSFHELLLDRLNDKNSTEYGYRYFTKIKKEAMHNVKNKQSLENEIDVIAMKGMLPVFISCKTGSSLQMDWIYEISSLSSYFKASAVITVSTDFSKQSHDMFSNRAYQMNVSLLGTESLWNTSRLNTAINNIINKKTYRYL